jgi:release factor glutamine methyltransferase
VTVEELLREGAEILPQREGIPDPRREARWLLARSLGVEESWLLIHPESTPSAEAADRFRTWIRRRADGEPAHHLTGRCTFWGLELEVSPAVLVPRPETELLVETALALPVTPKARVVDVGTGSGCVAIALASERPLWLVEAVDRSLAAVEVARRNIAAHRSAGVRLVCGDLATSFDGGYDLVVANLPYIPSQRLARLSREVRRDPPAALDGGGDGLALIRGLLADLPRLLKPCGGAALELGEDQADPVAEIASGFKLAVARRVRDLSGTDRVIVLQRRG